MSTTQPTDPLEWPADYPPSKGRRLFFIGVRWLGPDLSFFEALRKQQASRTELVMELWGDEPRRRSFARFICPLLKENMRWPTPFFVPGDRMRVLAAGPRYDPVDHLDWERLVMDLEKELGQRFPPAYWVTALAWTLGEMVDDLLRQCPSYSGPQSLFFSASR
jgi:hypothetical protein